MEPDKYPTKYFYSVDTFSSLREGKSEKKLLPENFNDFEKLLIQTGILIPKGVGIYQIRQPANDDPKTLRLWKKAWDYSNKATDLSIKTEWGFIDEIDRDLIHIIYDTEACPSDLVRSLLSDTLKRVSISPYNNYPNFYEKNISSVYELMSESNDLRGGKNPEDVNPDTLNLSFTKLKSKAKEILEKLQPFGLTRNEWYDINSFFLFS